MDKRQYERLSMKLHTILRSKSCVSWGLLSDVSENGLLIKSNRDFIMDEAVDIELFLPDNNSSLLRGVIRRKIELPDSHRKYGLGIELIEKDIVYRYFLRSLKGKIKTPIQTPRGTGDKQLNTDTTIRYGRNVISDSSQIGPVTVTARYVNGKVLKG